MRRSFLVLIALVLTMGASTSAYAQATPGPTRQAAGTRTDPILRGTGARIGDWYIEIVGFRQNANELIAAENQFNDPPAEGRQFAMATIQLTYKGDDIGNLFDLSFKAVGKSNVAYTTYGDSCGVVPDGSLFVSDIFPDGMVKVNYCWSVRSEDASNLLVYVEAMSSPYGTKPVFFNPRKQ